MNVEPYIIRVLSTNGDTSVIEVVEWIDTVLVEVSLPAKWDGIRFISLIKYNPFKIYIVAYSGIRKPTLDDIKEYV